MPEPGPEGPAVGTESFIHTPGYQEERGRVVRSTERGSDLNERSVHVHSGPGRGPGIVLNLLVGLLFARASSRMKDSKLCPRSLESISCRVTRSDQERARS
jgi:hypothetical protein